MSRKHFCSNNVASAGKKAYLRQPEYHRTSPSVTPDIDNTPHCEVFRPGSCSSSWNVTHDLPGLLTLTPAFRSGTRVRRPAPGRIRYRHGERGRSQDMCSEAEHGFA